MINRLLSMLFLLVPISAHSAQVYKCTSPEGAITFSNNPYCEQRQAYAKDRNEPVLIVKPEDITETPSEKIIELYYDNIDLPDVLEDIGRFADIAIEPIALEGIEINIKHASHHWLELLNNLVTRNNLDYRQAYDRLYVYKKGSMGETIVHSQDLLRWYQSNTSWNKVLKNDDIILKMKAYENSELKDRLPKLVRLVREDLGEESAVNAAESVVLKKSYKAGVGSGVATQANAGIENQKNAAEKAQRITERRQSN